MSATYTLIMMLAVAAGILVSRRTQTSLPLSGGQKFAIGLGAFAGAMLGAKLPFVFADWEGLLSGSAWFSDGKTILCGLVGGYFGVVATKWMLEIDVKTGDSFVVPVAVAVGIGRLACFSVGCCHGTPTSLPWGVVFPVVDQLPRHPSQLYEAAFHLTVAVVLYGLWRQGALRGQLIKLYFIAYFVFRFATEFIRPEARLWLTLTGYQWACLLLIVVFTWLWIRDAPTQESVGPQPAQT